MDARSELEGRIASRFDASRSGPSDSIALPSAQIDALGDRLEGVFRRELGDLCKELAAHTRITMFACIAAVMTSAGVALASARL